MQDALTGLANRRRFDQELEIAIVAPLGPAARTLCSCST